MDWTVIEVTQINLHHSKGASAVLARRQSVRRTAISLIQEPWVARGRVRGVAGPDGGGGDDSWQCWRHQEAGHLPGPLPAWRGDTAELVKLVDLCQKEGLPLVVRCDANVHHTIWGSTDTNERGRKLLEYLITTDLEVLNKDLKVEDKKIRNPKRTDWDSYQRDLERNLKDFARKHGTAGELELCVDHLQRVLVGSYEANCPDSHQQQGNPLVESTVAEPQGQGSKTLEQGEEYGPAFRLGSLQTQKEYRDSVVEAKKKSWRDFCEFVEGISTTARLCKFLSRNPDVALEAVRMSDGTMVSEERCLEHLLEASFPGFRRVDRCEEVGAGFFRACANDWKLAAEIVRPTRVRWVIGSFQPFKSAGPDLIFPALLQRDNQTPQEDVEGLSSSRLHPPSVEKDEIRLYS
ncbi:uncharacterized protein [Mycetomoellerius zeteki]|uniref:uncharacterized protein n=1 Tax=Mycetomoellerius zeteki TaxID=64791 RepID=UPI00084E8838|nr:PREDICTED: uncharacterized protein LOC108729531 [Trachymyrmex zeteki]